MPLVVWDPDFAAFQLERMMRVQGPGVSVSTNHREPLSVPPLKTTTYFMSPADWDDIVKETNEN